MKTASWPFELVTAEGVKRHKATYIMTQHCCQASKSLGRNNLNKPGKAKDSVILWLGVAND